MVNFIECLCKVGVMTSTFDSWEIRIFIKNNKNITIVQKTTMWNFEFTKSTKSQNNDK